ncbi:MAG: hypothetical protein E7122_01800 [Bacteroidales bacterium]|nr:hypothetical protein [Bacteroidales bacterium]
MENKEVKMNGTNGQRKFNFASDILGGQILSRLKTVDQYFIIYLFSLVIAFITFTLSVENTQLTMRRNQRELKNLKADYTAKAARLQYLSKRNEVEIRLEQHESSLQKPTDPAKTVKLVRRHN